MKDKKKYNAPIAEKITFTYQNQTVASGTSFFDKCHWEGTFTMMLWGCKDNLFNEGYMTN